MRSRFGQFPNAALFVFLGAFVLSLLLDLVGYGDTWFRAVVGLIGSAALLWWAIDELIRGVNPWRRILGAVVTVFVVIGLVGRFS